MRAAHVTGYLITMTLRQLEGTHLRGFSCCDAIVGPAHGCLYVAYM